MRNRRDKKDSKKYGKKKFEARRSKSDSPVAAKKYLGQHFLKDEDVAKRIAETLTLQGYQHVLEIGPGTGVLTKYLLLNEIRLTVMDLDTESITYLKTNFLLQHPKITSSERFTVLEADFLKFDLDQLYPGSPLMITGNFPYNISSQIVFKMLEHRDRIPEFSGMFQKEVAKRICETEGSKVYGILSVLVQAFYEAEYLFTVHPQVFDPPPKVQSGVLRLIRKEEWHLDCDEMLFFKVVKTAFGQRRKTLRNSLKSLQLTAESKLLPILDKRPEQLSVEEFITLTTELKFESQ